jgi:hypothetical protein
MSIEFFRPESQRPLDADGYELPPWLNPFLSDYRPELVEQADVAWLNENPTLPPITGGSPEPYEPTDADWDEMARWSAHLDRLEGLSREDDAEFEARMRYGN